MFRTWLNLVVEHRPVLRQSENSVGTFVGSTPGGGQSVIVLAPSLCRIGSIVHLPGASSDWVRAKSIGVPSTNSTLPGSLRASSVLRSAGPS